MAQIIKLKRNLAGGNKPTTSDLAIGELGMNVHDGKVFLRKSGSAGEGDNSISKEIRFRFRSRCN